MKQFWTKEEDALLRKVFSEGKQIKDVVPLFPGRTLESVKARVRNQGITYPCNRHWSAEEDAILREIWLAPRSIKNGLHRLPDRSYHSAKIRAKRLNLGMKPPSERGAQSWVLRAIIAVLGNGVQMTAQQIAVATGADRGSIQLHLARLRGVQFRVGGWERINSNHLSMRWALGPGEDAPKPSRKPALESHKAFRERMRIKKARLNPFATAAGFVPAPKSHGGRIYKQSMNVDMEEAA
jgi:hypothetical protein